MTKLLRAVLPLLLVLLSGCQTVGEPRRELTPEARVILTTSARIAVRHYLADHDNTAERVTRIRYVLTQVQSGLVAEVTVASLVAEAQRQLDKLELSPLDRGDAQDLLTALAVVITQQVGDGQLDGGALVEVSGYISSVLAALPG